MFILKYDKKAKPIEVFLEERSGGSIVLILRNNKGYKIVKVGLNQKNSIIESLYVTSPFVESEKGFLLGEDNKLWDLFENE